jgi:hypothetical protein
MPVDANELIRRWRDRRREILETLPPQLLAEYRQLGLLIRGVLTEQRAAALKERTQETERMIAEEEARLAKAMEELAAAQEEMRRLSAEAEREEARVPLDRHRETLIAFLAKKGPSTRREITAATPIPAGSLSLLLRDQRFEQVQHGLWRLRKGGN